MKPSKGELTKDVMNNQKTWFGETYQLEKKKHSLHMGHIWIVSNVSTLFSFCENRVLPSQMNGRTGTTLKNSSG